MGVEEGEGEREGRLEGGVHVLLPLPGHPGQPLAQGNPQLRPPFLPTRLVPPVMLVIPQSPPAHADPAQVQQALIEPAGYGVVDGIRGVAETEGGEVEGGEGGRGEGAAEEVAVEGGSVGRWLTRSLGGGDEEEERGGGQEVEREGVAGEHEDGVEAALEGVEGEAVSKLGSAAGLRAV